MQQVTPLPIDTVLSDVKDSLFNNCNVVLSALPGAGKTTRIPLALLHEPWVDNQKIIMLQPRRLAARSAARYMAHTLGEHVGQTVGYRTRLDTRVGPTTRIEVVTEGILTRLLQHDSSLTEYNLVIFDEYHERSLHADLGLALCLQTQEILRNDLRILVMSATLDCEGVSAILKKAPIITCEGKGFPIETHYVPREPHSHTEVAVVNCIKRSLANDTGNLLVFLPGAGEIRRVQQMLDKANLGSDVVIAPLYGNLSQQAQDQAIQPPTFGKRKVVLATPIAETSLTIEGIRVVIDSGLMRVPRFDPQSGMTRLMTVNVSQDSAQQRRGRAGRLEPGTCYRLWSEVEQHGLRQRTTPEILSVDLSPFALELAVWGITDPCTLSWLDAPPHGAFQQAQDLLTRLGGIDDNKRITSHGKKVSTLPLHPRLAHMLLRAQEIEATDLACEIAALLSERDFLKERNTDLRIRMDLLRTPTGLKQETTIDRATYHRVLKVAAQLQSLFSIPVSEKQKRSHGDSIGLLLAFAYPDRIAQRQNRQHEYYRLANGKSAVFKESENLATEEFVVIAELDGSKPHAHIFLAAPVRLENLEKHCPDQFQEIECVEWDEKLLAVHARRERRLGALVVEKFPPNNASSVLITETLLYGIRQLGIDCLPWTKDLRNWQARIAYVQRIEGTHSDWPDVSDSYLLETLENWLAPYLTGISRLTEVKRLKLNVPLHALLTWKQQKTLDQHAPTHMTVPTGSRVAIDYCSHHIPILAVRLQEMFGQRKTPTLAEGKGQVLLHLLSPARRPIQVTQDLASFWKNGYQEVKKELKGRYPKHYWPEDPLQAQPTRRIKPKL